MEEAQELAITLPSPHANVEEGATLALDDLHNNVVMAEMEVSIETEAVETEDTVWHAPITLDAKPGVQISDDLQVSANRTAIPIYRNDDGSITLTAYFAGPSYLPAKYGDADYGLVFNADYYALYYPEVVAEVGNDPQALLE